MPYHFQDDADFWAIAPRRLRYATTLAKAQNHRAALFVLGEEDNLDAPLALVLRMPEGFVAPRHSHPCHRLEMVLEGTHIREDGTILGPGDVSTSLPGEEYGPFLIGKGGSFSIEIFSKQSAMTPENSDENPTTIALAKLMAALNSGAITPEQAAEDPVLQQWGAEAIARKWEQWQRRP